MLLQFVLGNNMPQKVVEGRWWAKTVRSSYRLRRPPALEGARMGVDDQNELQESDPDGCDVSSGSWPARRWARQRVEGGPFVLRTPSPSRYALRTHSRGHGRPRVRHPTLSQCSTHPIDTCAAAAHRMAILCARGGYFDGKRQKHATLAQRDAAQSHFRAQVSTQRCNTVAQGKATVQHSGVRVKRLRRGRGEETKKAALENVQCRFYEDGNC